MIYLALESSQHRRAQKRVERLLRFLPDVYSTTIFRRSFRCTLYGHTLNGATRYSLIVTKKLYNANTGLDQPWILWGHGTKPIEMSQVRGLSFVCYLKNVMHANTVFNIIISVFRCYTADM